VDHKYPTAFSALRGSQISDCI